MKTRHLLQMASFALGAFICGRALAQPQPTTEAATDVAPNSATLNGKVWTSVSCSAWFEWGTTTNYGNTTSPTNLLGAFYEQLISAEISNLFAGFAYHYRLVVSNDSSGLAGGSDMTFTTPLFGEVNAGLTGVEYSSVAWGDYDNDGRLDILLMGDADSGRVALVYRNNEDGTFTNINAGLTGVFDSSVAWGDYGNDGNLDILTSRVYRNNGDNTFTDINAGLPEVSQGGSVAWGDFDNDGKQDILLAGSWSLPGLGAAVYHNNGDGTFTDINAGLTGVYQSSAACADYNSDGFLDILLTGYSGYGFLSSVYRNNGDGSFTDIGAGLPGVYLGAVAWCDFNSDGKPDILLTGMTNNWDAIARIYRNNGDGTFTDINAGFPGVYNSSVACGDFDNDGKPDILLTGRTNNFTTIARIYRNNGDSTFTDLNEGLSAVENGSVACGDLDNDGDLDILLSGSHADGGSSVRISRLYRNGMSVSNTPPSAPTGLSVAMTGTIVVFHWSAATDAETPSAGLTYNLRVGTTPGGSDIISPQSAADGWRRVPRADNVGHSLSFPAALPLGRTYYWSVQAVDSGFVGSPFAAEAVCSLNNLPVATTLPATEVGLTGSRAQAILNGAVNPGGAATMARFEWGTTTNYGSTTVVTNLDGGTNDVPVSVVLTNLDGNATYYFRMVAMNSLGEVFGTSEVFTTPIPAPSVSTEPATMIVARSAVLNARVSPNGAPTWAWFQFGSDTNYSWGNVGGTDVGNGTNELSVSHEMVGPGLQPGTTYHYRVGANNNGGYAYGDDMVFTTTTAQPLAIAYIPAPATSSNAVFGAGVNPNGEATLAWFEWGATTNYGHTTAVTNLGSGAAYIYFTSSIGGLSEGTMYHCRVVASNRLGQAWSGDMWCPVPSPQVVMEPPTDVTVNSATLHATVYPNGWPLTAWFRAPPDYAATQSFVSQRTNSVPLSLSVTGLVASQRYYSSFYASIGTFLTSAEQYFETPLPPIVSPLEVSALSSSNATFQGSVNPMGLPSSTWIEWGLTTNYGRTSGAVEVGTGNTTVPVAMDINQLSELRDYHFRLVVSNAGGVFYGEDNQESTLPGKMLPDGFYVSPTLLPVYKYSHDPRFRPPLVTVTACGARSFSGLGDPSRYRVRLTRDGEPTPVFLEPQSVTRDRLRFEFPPVLAGFYGFLIQTNKPGGVWKDFYESGPRFFQVGENAEAHVYNPVSRNGGLVVPPRNPKQFIGTTSCMVTGEITGAVSFTQHVHPEFIIPTNNWWDFYSWCIWPGVHQFGWTKDFPLDGEGPAGIVFTLKFPMDDEVKFIYSIPFQGFVHLPTNVWAGQNVPLKVSQLCFHHGTLTVEHKLGYSTTLEVWMNLPYDFALPALDIHLSQEPDKLKLWGKIPVAPKTDWEFASEDNPLDSNEIFGPFDPFGDGEYSYDSFRMRFAGHTNYNNVGHWTGMNNGYYEVRTPAQQVGWNERQKLWYVEAELIGLLADSGIPFVSEAAWALSEVYMELWQALQINVHSRDVIGLKPIYSYDLTLSIPTNWVNGPQTVMTNFSVPVPTTLISYYLQKLGGSLDFDMPCIDRINLVTWEKNDPLWAPERRFTTNLTANFSVSGPVWVTDGPTWKSNYVQSAESGQDYDLRSYFPEEAEEERMRIAKLEFKSPPPPPMVPTLILGTFRTKPESEFALMLASSPSVGGTIVVHPPPVDGGYSRGTVVTVTALAASGYQFAGWGGAIAGSANPTTVTMNDVKSLTASFRGPGLNSFDTASSAASWLTWPAWGLQFPVVWDGALDGGGAAGSGSLRYVVPFTGAADDQLMSFGTFANRWPWDNGTVFDGTRFANLSFDIKVAPGTAPTINGDYGDFEVGFLHQGPTDWELVPLPGFTLPFTNDWVHIVLPINPAAPGVDAIVGIYIKLWSGGKFTNTFSFNVDNVLLESRPSYEAAILANKPLAYYRLNEISGTNAFDCWGGHDGAYESMAKRGAVGPCEPAFHGFGPYNTALRATGNTDDSWVSAPFGGLSTNTVTVTAWICPDGSQLSWAGLLMTRGGGVDGGLGYNDQQMLAYTWNDNTTWDYVSGVVIPTNQWSFVAMVIEPTGATLYLGNTNGLLSATNAIAHTPDVFGNNWRIGSDAADSDLRAFNGVIDEVAVFTHALTPAQIQQLYNIGLSVPPVLLGVQRIGSELLLNWPSGTLQEADSATGPYSDVTGASSPYQVAPVAGQKFYRVKVQ